MPDPNLYYKQKGSLKISKDVVSAIAGRAVSDVDGVEKLAPITSNLTGWLWEKKTVMPISVKMEDGVAVIDVRIYLKDCVNASEVAKKVQQAVKDAVQSMAGIAVTKVNVYIAGIVFNNTEYK